MFTLLRRLRARLKYRHFDRDLRNEIDTHRAMKQEELEAIGLPPEDARARSLRDLGNVTYMREQARLIRLGSFGRALDQLSIDVRDSVRSLQRNPAFTVVTICVLALGIGLNTAIYSVAKWAFHPETRVPSPATLVYVSSQEPIRLKEFRTGTHEAFSAIATHAPMETVVVAGGRAASRAGEQVTANYFDVIGVAPAAGRTFHPDEDDEANPARAVVLSHEMWTQVLGSDPAAIGSEIRIGAVSFNVIGIAAEGFNGLSAPWQPSAYWVTRAQFFGNDNATVARVVAELGRYLVARLQPGVSLGQANAMVSAHADATASGKKTQTFLVRASSDVLLPFASDSSEKRLRMMASIVMGIGVLVLLIAGSNIAGVMSARGVSRRREFAVRQALGAGGWRLVRQRLNESLLLAAGGGVAGLGVTWALIRLYRAYSPAEFALDARLDAGALAFTTLVCLGAGLLLGLPPALQARKADLLKMLGGGVGAGIPLLQRRTLQTGVLVPQILFAVLLLMLGSAYASTLLRIGSPDPGYRIENVVAATVGYAEAFANQSARSRRFGTDLVTRLRQTPGITAAAIVTRLPSDHLSMVNNRWVTDEGKGYAEGVPAEGSWVSSGYFETFGIPLLRGRDFDDRDVIGAPAVAIISESLAKRLWPEEDAIGRSFGHAGSSRSSGGSGWYHWKQVIGVVADTRSPLQNEPHRPYLYTPLSQSDVTGVAVFVVAAGTSGVLPATRSAIEADPLGQVLKIETMEQTVARALYPLRAAAWLLGVSGIAGLSLAALGLYGVVSHSVAQQTREFGIRATLGASSNDLVKLVLKRGARVALSAAVPGVVLGLLGLRAATWFSRVAPSIDPQAVIAVLIFIAAVVMTACYIPARRAGRIDPVGTLRAD